MPVGIYPRTEKMKEDFRKRMLGNQYTLGKHWKCKKGFENRSKALKKNQNTKGKHWKWSNGSENLSRALKGNTNTKDKHWKISEKDKKKCRRTMIKYMETHKRNFENTDIEIIVRKELNKCCALDIINYYEEQKGFKKYLVDFYISELKLIVECFGTYWHKGFIRKYKDMKRKEYLEKLGYKVLILWDKEIYSKNFSLRRYLN